MFLFLSFYHYYRVFKHNNSTHLKRSVLACWTFSLQLKIIIIIEDEQRTGVVRGCGPRACLFSAKTTWKRSNQGLLFVANNLTHLIARLTSISHFSRCVRANISCM